MVFQILKRTYRKVKKSIPKIHRENFYEFDLINSSIPKIDKSFNYSWKLADLDSVEGLKIFNNLKIDLLKKRLKEDHSKCFITCFQESPIAYHWLQESDKHFIRPIGQTLDLGENMGIAVIYHTRVRNDMQGKGINAFLMKEILNYCKENNYNKVLVYTSSKNLPQIKSLSKLGFEFKRSIKSLKIGSNYFGLTTI